MITLDRVTKTYGTKRVVDDISFTVDPGTSIALWGSNGAGKTTLIRCLLGATTYQGEITVGGLSPRSRGKDVRRQIGYVPQVMPVFDMHVGDMVLLTARLRGATANEGLALLEHFSLEHTRSQSVASLSGGMRQKLALILALLGDPAVLLLDEPTANLDTTSQSELLRLLGKLKEDGRTIVFTSHRWGEVRALADQVVILERGRQVGGGTVAELVSDSDRVSIRIELPDGDSCRAQSMLNGNGYLATRNGNAVLVPIEARRKAEPIAQLVKAGYAIANFDVENEA